MSAPVEEIKVYGSLLKGISFEAVNLHPLADEIDVLKELDMSPDKCIHSDLYWAVQNKTIFLSIDCSRERDPFVSYHYKPDVEHGYSFYIVTNHCPLYTTTIENILSRLSDWIAENMVLS